MPKFHDMCGDTFMYRPGQHCYYLNKQKMPSRGKRFFKVTKNKQSAEQWLKICKTGSSEREQYKYSLLS